MTNQSEHNGHEHDTLSPLGRAAIELAVKYGFSVCPAKGKSPVQEHWPQVATSDPALVRQFWTERPTANIAVHCREWIVVDLDPDHGGFDSLRDLEAEHGALPKTVTNLTGGGGEHRIFRKPSDVQVMNVTGFRSGIDIKTAGGCIIVPPSTHPDTGKPYAWSADCHPDDISIAPAPAWLIDLLIERTRKQAATTYRLPAVIEDGERNNELYRYGRHLHARRVDPVEHEAKMREAHDRCRHPLSEQELAKLIRQTQEQPDCEGFGLNDGARAAKQSQATQLIDLALIHAELFHTPDREAFAVMQTGLHREVWPIRCKFFRQWLAGLFYAETRGAVGAQALQDALAVLCARSIFDSQQREVALRFAECNGNLYLDLTNDAWEVVEITKAGWDVIWESPVAFRRPNSALALPRPVHGGSLAPLREVLNLADDAQWTLYVGAVLGMLRPQGPYPVLALDGLQGTGKTSLARITKLMLDPAKGNNRAAPRTIRDLMVSASSSWVLSYDNISHLSVELSDALCRLSTGGGLSTRELYSDSDETIFDACRPVIINAIGEVITRPDLVDRAIILSPSAIPHTNRREEKKLMRQVMDIRPAVLGSLLDIVSCGLRQVDRVTLPALPRMADFAVWVTACAPALGWEPSRFLDTYEQNRLEAVSIGLDASPITAPLREWLALRESGNWQGTATSLLKQLTEIVGEAGARSREWPSMPNQLSNSLKRLAPAFRETGIDIQFHRSKGGRSLTITRLENIRETSLASSPIVTRQRSGDDGVTMGDDRVTMADSQQTPQEQRESDDGDGGDDEMPPTSVQEPLIIRADDPEEPCA